MWAYSSNELYHHGILGQKWGIRRYQNEDGTLTEEGKIRYGVKGDYDKQKVYEELKNKRSNVYSDNYSRSFYNPNNKQVDTKEMDKAIKPYGKALYEQYETIQDDFNKLADSRKNDYKEYYTSGKAYEQGLKDIKETYRENDEDEFLELAIYDTLNYNVPYSKNSKEISERLDQEFKDYYDVMDDFSKEILGEIGDKPIKNVRLTFENKKGLFGNTSVRKDVYDDSTASKELVKEILDSTSTESQWVHYLNNHKEMATNPYTVEDMDKETEEAYKKVRKKLLEYYDKDYLADDRYYAWR